jgi:F-type H+-transporting ATPase subunit a
LPTFAPNFWIQQKEIHKMKLHGFIKNLIFTLLAFAFTTSAQAGDHHGEETFNANEMIMHHILDAHEWHIMGPSHGEGAVSIYLPVILMDNGLQIFSSSQLYHGETKTFYNPATQAMDHYLAYFHKSGQGYGLFHEEIYHLDELGQLSFDEAGHPINSKPLDFSITKNVLSLFVGAILILALMLMAKSNYTKRGISAPKGIAAIIEPIVVFVRDDIAKTNIGHKYERYVPYLLTIFFFIWINNLLGLVPFFPGGANLTGNISVTLVLATITLLFTLFSSNKNYWVHIFATPGVPKALLPIMIPIEIIGIFTKPFALMVRLFANITAGHIIILSLIAIIFTFQSAGWAGLSLPMALFISCLELLVAILQAFIFTMLSALFIGAAVADDHH